MVFAKKMKICRKNIEIDYSWVALDAQNTLKLKL